MDSELSIDEIVTALHFSLEKTLKISLGPFVDKFNSSRNQFNVVSDLLKQLPEYKEIIKHNAMLSEENRILKEYIRKQNAKNNTTNRIKLEISEKDDQEEIEKIFSEAENEETAKFGITSTMESEEEALTREEEDEDEEEEVEVDEEEEEVEVVEVDVEEEEDEVVEVDVEEEEVDEEEEVEVVEEEEEEVEVDEEEEEVEVEVEVDEEEEEVEVEEEEEVEVVEEEDDDEISNNDVSQTPRSVVNTNEETEDEDDDDEEGLIEVVISGKDYFADNDEDGDIYEKISDDEPGDDPIGIFKDGVATFF